MANAPPDSWGWLRPEMAGVLLALLLHGASIGHGFVRDDVPLIADNPALRAAGPWSLLTRDFLASTGFLSGLWRPLPLLSFWVDGHLGGWRPAWFHATSVLLYLLCVLALGRLLTQARIPRIPAVLGLLWFAAMPAHLEPVAWVSGRTDLLCGLLALLSLWLDRRDRERGRSGPGWAALAAFTGALLSKEAAAAWLGVVFVAEWVRGRHHPVGTRQVVRWMAPYVLLTAVWLVAHQTAAGEAVLPPYVDEALRARRQAAGWVMLPRYLSFLWPGFPHASDVPVPLPGAPWGVEVLAGAAFTVAAFAGGVVLAARRSRLALPVGIVLAPLLPPIAMAVGRGFVSSGERMMFLPSAGAAWLVAMGLSWAWRRGATVRRVAGGLATALIASSAFETARLQPSWANDERVFRTMTERQPRDPAGWVGLGEALTRAGRLEEAGRTLERAAELGPRLPAVHAALAEVHYLAGDWDHVLVEVRRALELDGRLPRPRLLRASTLVRLGRPGESVADIEWLLAARPGDPDALLVEGQRWLAEGRPERAIAPLEAAAEARPQDPGAWAMLGHARASTGDLPAARAALERALALGPGPPALWRRLASVCAALGDSVAARAALGRAGRASD